LIEELRRERVRFAMAFSREATDTMLEGADPVAGTLHKAQPDFMAKLRRLYRDVPVTDFKTIRN
jgi:salicylate hydroxylase